MTDGALEAALRDLADEIDWPTPVDFTMRLQLDGKARSKWRPRVVWTAAVLILILAVVLIPTTRNAVANLLEVAGIRFEFGGDPELPTPTELAPGEQVDIEAARDAVDFSILTPTVLDPPTAVHLVQSDLGTQVFLAWVSSDRLPEVGDSGIGLLLGEFRANLDDAFFSKIVLEGTFVDRVIVGGVSGFWLSGAPHVFMFETGQRDRIGDGTRLTGNVLVWETEGITYRLESGLNLADSLEIAESLSP